MNTSASRVHPTRDDMYGFGETVLKATFNAQDEMPEYRSLICGKRQLPETRLTVQDILKCDWMVNWALPEFERSNTEARTSGAVVGTKMKPSGVTGDVG
ncbi:hypothetical protein AJ80_01954 [Polytolypa hystricis UAMH7299]|uniref:Uncharacterized protein n=1 Tax=Polytolypa hystricis (strain UAMH7299) TaxID=1447883 RepID=A0A2B7YSP6_POLH7|nr:hypothetical protein AJ80_01954 [Polytolypa hystricis UAMH7299]